MKKFRLLLAWLSLFLLLASAAALAADPGYVIVDTSDPATTVYISLPANVPAADLQRTTDNVARVQGSYLVGWKEFTADTGKHIRSHIRRNDYPEADMATGMTQLLQKYTASPFGLTWNGGLAITRTDYQYASHTLATYNADPAAVVRLSDASRDPVNPGTQLGPLLHPEKK